MKSQIVLQTAAIVAGLIAAFVVFAAADDATFSYPYPPWPTPKVEERVAPADAEIVRSPISKTAPLYPLRAWEAEKEGRITVKVAINPDGDVSYVRVVEAVPTGWFEEATITAITQWKYRAPGREITFYVDVEFKIPPDMRLPRRD